jgi:hypothetical protein
MEKSQQAKSGSANLDHETIRYPSYGLFPTGRFATIRVRFLRLSSLPLDFTGPARLSLGR